MVRNRESGDDVEMSSLHENEIADQVLDVAFSLHRDLGPGLLESVYEVLLAQALKEAGLRVQRQVVIPIHYNGIQLDEGFRADLIVEESVILELKSVERINPSHKKQLLTYLKLSHLKVGYLLNFGEALMKDGITRIINGQLPPCSPCRRERK